MPLSRRRLLAAAGLSAIGLSGAAYGIRYQRRHRRDVAVDGDDGKALITMRLPAEGLAVLAALPGVTAIGAPEAGVSLYEFSDYNCPECRVAAGDLAALAGAEPSVRIVLVNNPIVSAPSAQAARVAIAVQQAHGSEAAFSLYERLFSGRGRIDGARALDGAAALGLPRAALEREMAGEAVAEDLRRQMRAATDLGLYATPSYVIGGIGVIGHPGPKSLAGMIAALRSCDRNACG